MTKITDTVSAVTTSTNADDVDTVDNLHASDLASSGHNHDDRYYTETEFDAIIAGLTHPAKLRRTGAGNRVYYRYGGYGSAYLNYIQ